MSNPRRTSASKTRGDFPEATVLTDATTPAQVNSETTEESDIALMEKSGGGDLSAFETLVKRHQAAVVGTAAKMLGSSADAEDIAQQVFLRAWKNAPHYRPTAKFTTWLMTITRNLVFNESRRKKRAPMFSMQEPRSSDDLETREFPDPSQRSAGALVQQRELEAAIDAALASLPEKSRMALVLRRYEGMPYEEIAQTLGLSVPAVKSLLFRARSELKEKLADFL